MGFKQIADLDASVTVAIGGKNKETGKSNPTSIEGYFIGTRKVESRKAKSGWCSLHILQTSKGNVGVWGKTNLDQKLTAVTPGQMIRVSFTGMVETRNNPMYKYKVEVDADNSIEVNLAEDTAAGQEPEAATETTSYGADKGSYEEPEAETGLDEDETPYDEAPKGPARRAAAQAPSPERQQKVQGLLGSRRNTG